MSNKKPIILLGVKQESRYLMVAAESQGREIVAMVDRFYVGQTIDDLPVIASDLDLLDPSSHLYKTKDDYDWFVSTHFVGRTNVKKDEENSWLLRNQRADIAQKANLNLINIQHANSFVDPTSKLGKNVYIGWGCYIGAYSTIGDFNIIGMNVAFGHHITTGDFCMIFNSVISGGTTIGNNVVLGYSVDVVRPGPEPTTIGNNVIVAPGTIVSKSIPDDTILFQQGKTRKNIHFIM
jgi:acetyltransferase-like isoleucine patch superfamily enzyme